jgi:hypothetical protein
MKRSINPGFGASPVLALFILAAIHLSACGDGSSKVGTPEADLLTNHVILVARDSSQGGGSSTGGKPLVILTCLDLKCPMMQLGSYTPVAAGTDSVDYVIVAKTTGAIPANATVRMEIRVKRDAAAPLANGEKK